MEWLDCLIDICKKKYSIYTIVSILLLTIAFIFTIELGPKINEYFVDELECRVYEKLGLGVDLNHNGILKFEASNNEDTDREMMFESENVKTYSEPDEEPEDLSLKGETEG